MNKLFSLLYIFICSLMTANANAAFIFFEELKKEQGSSYTAVDEANPHWKSLYDILAKYQWPMSILTSFDSTQEKSTEEETILHFLEAYNIKNQTHFHAVWIPQTLFELGAIHLWESYSEDEQKRFPPTGFNSTEFIQYLIKNCHSDADGFLNQSYRYDNERYCSLWGVVNYKIGVDLLEIGNGHGDSESFLSKQPFAVLNRNILNELRKLYHHIAKEPDQQETSSQKDSENVPEDESHDFWHISTHESIQNQDTSMMMRIFDEEIKNYLEKKDIAFLYRGTDGLYEDLPVKDRFLDSIHLLPSPNTSASTSSSDPTLIFLSFGTSLLAGHFSDPSAMAMYYFVEKPLGYLLGLDKREYRSNGKVRQLFFIPPYGIGGLFHFGEFFHSRNRIGVNSVSSQTLTQGIDSDIFAPTLEDLKKVPGLVNFQKTPDDLTTELAEYIANHSIIVSHYGNRIKNEVAESVIRNQHTHVNELKAAHSLKRDSSSDPSDLKIFEESKSRKRRKSNNT